MSKEEYFEDENKKEDKKQKPNTFFKAKKQGRVVSINKKRNKIIVDVSGNGEQIDYNEKEHANLKVGDSIEF